MPEILTLAPGIEVPKPDDGAELRYNQAAVERVETFFSMLVFGQNDWAGKPFELLPWERDLIRRFYGIEVKDDDGRLFEIALLDLAPAVGALLVSLSQCLLRLAGGNKPLVLGHQIAPQRVGVQLRVEPGGDQPLAAKFRAQRAEEEVHDSRCDIAAAVIDREKAALDAEGLGDFTQNLRLRPFAQDVFI